MGQLLVIAQMMRDAETYREADAEANARTEAKQEFERVAYGAKAKLAARPRSRGAAEDVHEIVEKALAWLEDNPNGSVQDYRRQTRILQEALERAGLSSMEGTGDGTSDAGADEHVEFEGDATDDTDEL